MCARFSLTAPAELLARFFGIDALETILPRYNIAPTQRAAVVRAEGGARVLAFFRFGLVPSWASDEGIATRLVNAREETLFEKRAFRAAARRRRCLVLADGYYEWQAEGGRKLPVLFRRRDEAPFAFAGIWETWQGGAERQASLFGQAAAEPLHTFAIVTRAAGPLVRGVHERMPAILRPTDHDAWLDPGSGDEDGLRQVLARCDDSDLKAEPLEPTVNNVRAERPECWTVRA